MTRGIWTAPAKVNLFLEVLGRREDGFHEIRTVFQAIDLCDRLEIEPTAGEELLLTCPGAELPTGPGNLVRRAWEGLKRRVAFSGGAQVRLTKRIPIGAGLGGGSSDAAALLCAANAHAGLGLRADELEAVAAEVGSDAAFFVRGGTQLGEGRGERLAAWPALRRGAFLVVWPGYPLSTAEVYAAGRFRLTPEGDPLTILRLGLTREEPEGVARALFNALEGPAFSLYPGLSRLKGKLLGLGASGALLCGSGSAIFAYFAEVEAARRAVPVLAAETRAVHLALPLPAGAQRLA